MRENNRKTILQIKKGTNITIDLCLQSLAGTCNYNYSVTDDHYGNTFPIPIPSTKKPIRKRINILDSFLSLVETTGVASERAITSHSSSSSSSSNGLPYWLTQHCCPHRTYIIHQHYHQSGESHLQLLIQWQSLYHCCWPVSLSLSLSLSQWL